MTFWQKNLLAFLVIAISICGLIFLNNNQEKTQNDIKISCDLNQENCQNSGVIFILNPRPILPLSQSILEIKGLDENLTDPKIKIYGLNMDMGATILPLKKTQNSYQTNVAFSVCLLEKMFYRIEILDGTKPLNIFADIVIKSQ